MQLTGFDWAIIGAYFLLALGVGLWASKQAGKDAKSFFSRWTIDALVASWGEHGRDHLFNGYA